MPDWFLVYSIKNNPEKFYGILNGSPVCLYQSQADIM